MILAYFLASAQTKQTWARRKPSLLPLPVVMKYTILYGLVYLKIVYFIFDKKTFCSVTDIAGRSDHASDSPTANAAVV